MSDARDLQSAVLPLLPWLRTIPPGAELDQGDLQALAGCYGGILAGGLVRRTVTLAVELQRSATMGVDLETAAALDVTLQRSLTLPVDLEVT